VVAELDAHGQIDEHAAMCLRNAVDHPVAPATQIVIDLRDLTAISSHSLALLIAATARCKTRALGLTLLLSGGADHAAIADALVRAGFGVCQDRLQRRRDPGTAIAPAPAAQRRRERRWTPIPDPAAG
jgi:anti-anti-sigma factor